MRRVFLCCAILLLATVSACTDRPTATQAPQETAGIRQTAIYQDFQDNRVLAYVYADGTSEQAIRDHAESLPHSSDRLLAVYYFAEGSSTIAANDLRWARSIMQAMDSLFDQPDLDPWSYVFMRTFVGETRFTNCTQAPDDALCRGR